MRLRPSVAHMALYTQWTPVACRKFSSGVFPPLVFRADRTPCAFSFYQLCWGKIDLGSCPESQAHFTACVENTPSLLVYVQDLVYQRVAIHFICSLHDTAIDTSVCSCLICDDVLVKMLHNQVHSCRDSCHVSIKFNLVTNWNYQTRSCWLAVIPEHVKVNGLVSPPIITCIVSLTLTWKYLPCCYVFAWMNASMLVASWVINGLHWPTLSSLLERKQSSERLPRKWQKDPVEWATSVQLFGWIPPTAVYLLLPFAGAFPLGRSFIQALT